MPAADLARGLRWPGSGGSSPPPPGTQARPCHGGTIAGRTAIFDTATLARLYPGGHDDYLERLTQALDDAIAAGFVLAEDREEIRNLEAASYP